MREFDKKNMPDYIYGRHPVIDAIKSKIAKRVLIDKDVKSDDVLACLKDSGIKWNYVSKNELDKMFKNQIHQGFAAEISEFKYSSIEEIIESSKCHKYPLVVMLDGIEDPHNFGAIIRTCDAFGVDGIIIKKRNQVGVNSTVFKTSTGAVNHVKIAQVANLVNSIEILKKAGFWVVSSDGSAKQLITDVDYKMPVLLVVGSEGFGISSLVMKNSDFIVKIPMEGSVNSLNASVAAAIFISTIKFSR